MDGWKKNGKEGGKEGKIGFPPFQSSILSIFQSLMFVLIFMSAIAVSTPVPLAAESKEIPPVNDNSPKTKEEQNRQILIEIDRLKMELAEKLMKKKQVDLENLKAMMMEENNIVTVSEVNKAEEAYERAVDEYEQAKLTLQQTELASLQDEWHITVETTRLYESADGRELFSITLRNSSSPVKLVESSKVLGEKLSSVRRLTTSSSRLKNRKVMAQAEQPLPNLTNNGLRRSKRVNRSLWSLNS